MEPPAQAALASLFPREIGGWTADGPDGLYDAETLYAYIDGGAEVYRHLNVQSVLGRRYVRRGAPEIIADLFDMGSAADAFGAFHHDRREGEQAGVGRESEYEAGALAFWKGRYFASILAMEETPEARRTVLDLGRRIAESIEQEGEPPPLARLLPEGGLVRSQVHYFHTQPSLDMYLPLPGRDLLGLTRKTEGLLARYRVPAGGSDSHPPCALLLVAYPSAPEAQGALERLAGEVAPSAAPGQAARGGDGTWGGALAIGEILAAVLEASSGREVEALLEEAATRIKGRSSASGGTP